MDSIIIKITNHFLISILCKIIVINHFINVLCFIKNIECIAIFLQCSQSSLSCDCIRVALGISDAISMMNAEEYQSTQGIFSSETTNDSKDFQNYLLKPYTL